MHLTDIVLGCSEFLKPFPMYQAYMIGIAAQYMPVEDIYEFMAKLEARLDGTDVGTVWTDESNIVRASMINNFTDQDWIVLGAHPLMVEDIKSVTTNIAMVQTTFYMMWHSSNVSPGAYNVAKAVGGVIISRYEAAQIAPHKLKKIIGTVFQIENHPNVGRMAEGGNGYFALVLMLIKTESIEKIKKLMDDDDDPKFKLTKQDFHIYSKK